MSLLVFALLAANLLFLTGSLNGIRISSWTRDPHSFAFSIGAVIWVLTPEIFPNHIRSRAMSIAVFSNWVTNAGAAYIFPWYVASFGMHTGFLTFAVICFIATLFFWRFVPETKGKSLEEIERIWMRKN